MKRGFEIRGRVVGEGAPCYIVAEAGSNHNGSLEMALKLVDVASEAGADAVKFQTFKAKRLYPKSAGSSDYLGDERSIFDIIAAMEMPEAWLPELSARAHAAGMAFISSPFHEDAVAVLDPYVDAFKIASYEMNHTPLLREVARCGKPVIMSTGASHLDEVHASLEVLRAEGCEDVVVLQCTAAYPAPLEAVNVRALVTLRESLGVASGLSDHSSDPVIAPMTAAALGANLIEKHYTLSKLLPGPDHAFAIEPEGLARLVASVRAVEMALGTGDKKVQAVENELRSFARRSVFAIASIAKGEPFTRDNVDVLRNGKLVPGLPPDWLDRVLTATAARDITLDKALTEDDLVLP
jgi:N-acetylneuraminate synthase